MNNENDNDKGEELVTIDNMMKSSAYNNWNQLNHTIDVIQNEEPTIDIE